MANCQKCYNKRSFLQYSIERGIKRKIDFSSGEAKHGAVQDMDPKEKEAKLDGLYCSKCGYRFTGNLNEMGVPSFGRLLNENYDLETIKERINDEVRKQDADVEYHEEKPAPEVTEGVKLSDTINGILQNKLGISKLYSHQAEAIKRIREGKSTVVQTKTASGKSLCFQIPVLEAMINRELKPTAIFIFPTKALAYDQLSKLARFSDDNVDPDDPILNLSIGGTKIRAVNINKDTWGKLKVDKAGECYSADIVITNPDFIHANMFNRIVTKKGTWVPFLSKLKYVVVDEAHQYRGVFGANTALLFRRLRMICRKKGGDPQFICLSATLSNPIEHAERLTGVKPFELVDRDGAPHHKKSFFLLNPKEKEDGEVKEASTVALSVLLEKGILFNRDYQVQTIVFGRSRKSVITLCNRAKRAAGRIHADTGWPKEEVVKMLASFMGTDSDEDRRTTIDKIKTKEIAIIFSTNALELGIDISTITCTMIVDYPGTSTSLIQQMGRSGRDRDSITFLILKNEPLQQYFFRHKDEFFKMLKTPEPAVLNYDKEELLETALKALKLEEIRLHENFEEQEIGRAFGEAGLAIWKGLDVKDDEPTVKEVYLKGLRSVYSSFDIYCKGKVMGRVDELTVGRDLHPGAIWENNYGTYESELIDYANGRVTVTKMDEEKVDYYTICAPQDKISINSEDKAGNGLFQGSVEVSRQFKGYFKKPYSHSEKMDGPHWINQNRVRPIVRNMNAFWLRIAKTDSESDAQLGGVIGLRNLLTIWVPQFARCDRGDISCNIEDLNEDWGLFVYDQFLIGVGYSDVFKRRMKEILNQCLRFVNDCECKNGCPKCLYLPAYDNEQINKKATIELLNSLIGAL